jgi:histidine ammonia-lyase
VSGAGAGEVRIDGRSLTRADVVRVARAAEAGRPAVSLAAEARERLRRMRSVVEERWLGPEAPTTYGFNTGVGALKDRIVPQEQMREFQVDYLRSHAVGVGAPLKVAEVRATILVKASNLAVGRSGVRPEVIEALLDMLNRRVHPVMPCQGSMGASGDLAPLSHLALVLAGESDDVLDGAGRPGASALALGFKPVTLEAKEAMALTNSASVIHAIGLLAVADAENALLSADLAAALSCEAMLAEAAAFDARLQEARGFPGQVAAAENVRRLREGSGWTTEDARRTFHEVRGERGELPPRVQDAYSLRCVPQVHGACHDAWRVAAGAMDRELNAATDNPLIFEETDGRPVALSGGNFHGQPLALPLDHLSLALATLGNISERRAFRLLNPHLSYGLPLNLVPGGQEHRTGLMITQYTAAALVSENKGLAHPASADSIPASGGQEDHVSMGTISARHAAAIVENVTRILAVEILCATQGILLARERLGAAAPSLGRGTGPVVSVLEAAGAGPYPREEVYAREIEKVAALVGSGALVGAAEKGIGGRLRV